MKMVKNTTLKNTTLKNANNNLNNKRLLWATHKDKEAIFSQFETTAQGFDEKAANKMRDKYGKNEITHSTKDTLLLKLYRSFINPFTLVLLTLAVVSLITDVLVAPIGERDYTAVIIISMMVTISGLLRFIQEERSGKAAKALSQMVKTTIAVQRKDQGKVELPIDELVVGDIIYLAAGDMVPADLRIVQVKDLFVAQSALTGESDPKEKFSGVISEEKPLLECDNLAFMGTNVVSGSAIGVVISVGDDTLFGTLAQDITGKKPTTSFEKGVNSVSWVLIRFMMIMVPIVLFINGFTKGDWLEAFLFAISIAVGLTPEMLPMLVSANLARGAVAMAKKDVIVKDLNSMQNFGAMDVLCTDKTGTLTQDKVALVHSLDIHGHADERVLRHAYMNSFYQTGLKNLMDVAVISFANEHQLTQNCEGFQKVDEIPFDFSRRRMSVVVKKQDKTQLITKGAVEEMLSICSFAEYKGEIQPMSQLIREEILATVEKLSQDGMRILAVAQKSNPSPVGDFSVEDEKDMVLMGYLAFLDPPKESTAGALAALKEYGVAVKILTGDTDAVAKYTCKQVGIPVENIMLGSNIEALDDHDLRASVEVVDVFAKLSPSQKARVVSALRANGHTVGFMGDGINDASAMKASDVGISVDTAVDIAKETANIILLKKDLMILEKGVIEGRKTYANIIKYIKMTASSNFGNMFSVLAASAFLPFLPMLPIQILALNLIYDISCLTIPWDNVDEDYLKKPRKWDASSISKFMLWIGPTSSVFDIITYMMMFWLICPMVFGGAYSGLSSEVKQQFMSLFQTGWFVESLWSQTLVIHMIRSPKIPFIESRASWQLSLLTSVGIAFGTVIPFTKIGDMLGMMHLPKPYFAGLGVIILCYMLLATVVKKMFIKKYKELL